MQTNLYNKKIAFIGPKFYEYHNIIKGKLEEFGAQVDFYAERKYNFSYSFFNNFSKKALLRYQASHYDAIQKEILLTQYDYLFVIRGCEMPAEFVQAVKSKWPAIITIMYQWDSMKANDYSALIPYFDYVYSFDYLDADNHEKIQYLALFYTSDIRELRQEKHRQEIDFFSISSYRQDRYLYLLKFIDYCEKNNYSLKYHLYIPLTTYIKSLLKGERLKRSILSFSPVKRSKYLRYIAATKVVVDISPSVQTGLSMRTIETLGAGKKLVTTNKYILREKFYSPEQIKLWTEEKMDNFIQQPFSVKKEIDESLLDQWLLHIFKASTE